MTQSRPAAGHDRTGSGDRPSRSRRRGKVLEEAIFDATLAALSETGYANLTMERIAARAGTSKAALYRRWASRAELVADTIRYALPGQDLPDTGSLREDVLRLLRLIATRLAGPAGEAARGLIGESLRDPIRTEVARQRMIQTHPEYMQIILRRALDRGEAGPHALLGRIADAGPALLQHHFLIHGTPIPDDVLVSITDDVVLPLAMPRPA